MFVLIFSSIKLLTFPLSVKVTFVPVTNEIKLNVHLEILNVHINVFYYLKFGSILCNDNVTITENL